MSTPPPPPGAVSPQWQPPPRYQPPPPALAPNGQPLASFTDRLMAYLIDYAIQVGFALLWTVPLTIWWLFQFTDFVNENFTPYTSEPEQPPNIGAFWDLYLSMIYFILASMVLAALFTYIYWVEIQMRRGGQTVGKRVIKIRVIPVNPAETVIGRRGYVKRWAVQFLTGMIVPLFQLIDGLWQLADKPLQQCLHDKAAGTVVVKVG